MTNLFKDNTNIYNNKENDIDNENNINNENNICIDNENNEDIEKNNIIDSLQIGQIICGKVGKYPWWPCMVSIDKFGNYMRKNVIDNKVEVLVSYFGKIREYSYLTNGRIINVNTKKKFDDHVRQEVLKYGKKASNSFKCSSNHKEPLKLAWIETEKALEMDIDGRIKKYNLGLEIKDRIPKRKRKRYYMKFLKNIQIQPKIKIKPVPKEKEPTKYAFTELDMPYAQVRSNEKCCQYCLEMKNIIACDRNCGSYFHKKCVETLKSIKKINTDKLTTCMDCWEGNLYCYACYKPIDCGDSTETRGLQCSIVSCLKWYHWACVETGALYEMTKWPTANKLVCPRHLCHKCELISPFPKYKCKKLTVCLMCPSAFHTGDWCIPAGSYELSCKEIICPRHLFGGQYLKSISFPRFIGRVKSSISEEIYGEKLQGLPPDSVLQIPTRPIKPINVNWCFKCSEGGKLLCCESCPAAYHIKCASLFEIPNRFYCSDCTAGCFRSYGEIIWIKCGSYRWWPGQILHEAHVPNNIVSKPHSIGQFAVQFFGTQEYTWSDGGRVFIYEEDDKDNIKGYERSGNIKSYLLGVEEASKGVVARNLAWKSCSSNQIMSSRSYSSITTNKYTVPMKRLKTMHTCYCTPLDPLKNCSVGSNCLNIELKYECQPEFCKNGENCQNQNFVKRNYPLQEIFWSGECGWALKTKVFIEKHQFVNEYVGEVIDKQEAEDRIKWANKNNFIHFYFMELVNNLIIDARHYSNLSRFMNHSCNPNISAEKWVVNGEDRVGLFALRDIEVDEELTFNYNICTKSHIKIPCKCKSDKCSGFIGEAPKILESKESSLIKSRQLICKPRIVRKRLKLRTKKIKKISEVEEISSVSKESFSTSCLSFSTEHSIELICFRCCGDVDETKYITCTYPECSLIFHVQCLDVKNHNYDKESWICPCHYCDICGAISSKFCIFCTTSVCKVHLVSGKLFNKTEDNNMCLTHEYQSLTINDKL